MLRRNWKKIALALLVLLAIIFYFFYFRGGIKTQQDKGALNFMSIIPGSSTQNDVIGKLGDPVSVKESGGKVTLEYKSNNQNFNNLVVIENDKVVYIKEIITNPDPKTVSSITKIYGNAPYVLYGPRAGVGFYLYSYPAQGIAYVGNARLGELLEIWYFVPVSYDDFKQTYSKDYSEQRQQIQ